MEFKMVMLWDKIICKKKKLYMIFLVTKIMKRSLGDALELKETN
jgi:hypothetical protein